MTTTKVQSDMVDIDGATTATIAVGDKLNFLDITDSLVKEDTVQGILDLAGGGGAWNIIGTNVASGSASLTQTGLDSTYDTYAIAFSDMHPATDDATAYFRFGDSSGIDSASDDYEFSGMTFLSNSDDHLINQGTSNETEFVLGDTIGTAAGDFFGGIYYIHRPGDGTSRPFITGHATWTRTANAQLRGANFFGMRNAVIALDRVQFLFSNGNIATGRMTVWGIAHA